jgi:hypothetical protein
VRAKRIVLVGRVAPSPVIDLEGVVVVADGTLVERALDAGRNLGKLLVRVSDPST